MSLITQQIPMPPQQPDDTDRFAIAQFDRMVQSGEIDEDDPVELLDGIVVCKTPKSPRHRVSVRKTLRALERVIPEAWHVEKQEPIVIPPEGKPEPDVAVIRRELEFDATRDASADQCCLVVEVAETKLARARTHKLSMYARAMTPVYWIVNVDARQLEVYAHPVPGARAGGTYPPPTIMGETESVALTIGGQLVGRIAVADLLPSRP